MSFLHSLQSAASRVAGRLGHSSRSIRLLRPAYEAVLGAASIGRGVDWVINGELFRVDPTERHRVAHVYEPAVARVLKERLTPGMTFLDVGANVGVFVLQASRLVGAAGRVIALEPNPEARRYLRRHIDLNKFQNRVTILPFAAGRGASTAKFFVEDADGMSRLDRPNELLTNARPIEVRVEALDQTFAAADNDPDVMLVDVEGYEMDVLAGAKQLITRRPGMTIIVEMHPGAWPACGTDVAKARNLFRTLGRRAVSLDGRSDPFTTHAGVELVPVAEG